METYLLICDGNLVYETTSFSELLKNLKACSQSSRLMVVRGRIVISLVGDEVRELVARYQPVRGEPKEQKRLAVVLDQMYKGFAEVLSREVARPNIEFHEIVGRGLEKPVKIGRVSLQPARDDYDVLKLLEELKQRGSVLFFTGDKRLAQQAAALGVEVEYMPPGEFTGKEAAIRAMLEKIKERLS